MKIDKVVVGDLLENCYIISDNNKNCLIVDPGSEESKIINCIKDKKVIGILITHHHFDHVGVLDIIKEKYKTNVYDYSNLVEKEYTIGTFTFKVMFNPGHTSDSISFYFEKEKVIFVGDFVFKESIGRCDLEGGNYKEMLTSINKLLKINDDIIIYPGHGEKTSLFYEKEHNPFF